MFSFKISPVELCKNKVYVFNDSFLLKSCLQSLQNAHILIEGIYLTKEDFFDSLRQRIEGKIIPVDYRYPAFWQSCYPFLDYSQSYSKSKSFFAFWSEMNSLEQDLHSIEKILASNQKLYFKKMFEDKEKYLLHLQSLKFVDVEVEGFSYETKSNYDIPVVFYDCYSFTPKQKKWLFENESKIELKFSFSKDIYDCENFAFKDFEISDLHWLPVPKIDIKQYQSKIFMDAAIVNDGYTVVYGKKSHSAFNIFGSDNLLQDRSAFHILRALLEILKDREAGKKVAIGKLLRLVTLRAWKSEDDQQKVIDKDLLIFLINNRYKFFPAKGKYKELHNSFEQFLDIFRNSFSFATEYMLGLDENSIYVDRVQTLGEIAKALQLSSVQALEFFLHKFANNVVAVDENKLIIHPVKRIKAELNLALYNFTEPFWDNVKKTSDFFSPQQREKLSLISDNQSKNEQRFSFFSLISQSAKVDIYTYENAGDNVQRASVIEEILQSSWEAKEHLFSDLDLRELVKYLLQGEHCFSAGNKSDLIFPFRGQKLDEFSYSQAVLFLEDAAKFYKENILKIREFLLPSDDIEHSLLGEIAHKIFQNWLQSGNFAALDKISNDVLCEYEDKLPDNYHKIYFEKYVVEDIKKSAKKFWQKYTKTSGECEKSLTKYFSEFGITLRGRIDYLNQEALYDFKTGSKKNANMSQLEFYGLLGGDLASYFYFVFDEEIKPYSPAKNELPILRQLKAKIGQVKNEGFRE